MGYDPVRANADPCLDTNARRAAKALNDLLGQEEQSDIIAFACGQLLQPPCFKAHPAHDKQMRLRGSGVMQSYGAGQALAELIATGRYARFDASALDRARFARNQPALEELHI